MRSSVDSGVRFQISILSQATCVSLDKLFHFSVPCCPHLENDGIEKSRAATGQGCNGAGLQRGRASEECACITLTVVFPLKFAPWEPRWTHPSPSPDLLHKVITEIK